MKVASKVFIIIAMVFVPLTALICLIDVSLLKSVLSSYFSNNPGYSNYSGDLDAYISLITTMMVISLFIQTVIVETIGGLALHKMSVATSKDQLIPMGVVTLIFCSLLGGIFMLCIPKEDFQNNVATPVA